MTVCAFQKPAFVPSSGTQIVCDTSFDRLHACLSSGVSKDCKSEKVPCLYSCRSFWDWLLGVGAAI